MAPAGTDNAIKRGNARKELHEMTTASPKSGTGLQPNVAGLLCYLAWWVTGIIFLILEKDNKTVKFHAWQSILTFVAITIVWIVLQILSIIIWPFYVLLIILWLISVILWIVLMVKAYQGQMWKVPVVGDIAAKQAGV
jgi:uncharacterized membrane protein